MSLRLDNASRRSLLSPSRNYTPRVCNDVAPLTLRHSLMRCLRWKVERLRVGWFCFCRVLPHAWPTGLPSGQGSIPLAVDHSNVSLWIILKKSSTLPLRQPFVSRARFNIYQPRYNRFARSRGGGSIMSTFISAVRRSHWTDCYLDA